MQLLKQSTAATVLVGPVLDSAGAAYTSMAIGDFNITKNGTTAAMASAATATHDHNGMYLIALTTGNTDTLGRLVISANKATYAMSAFAYTVLTTSTFDALVTNAATAAGGLQDIQRLAGQAITAAAGVTFPTSIAAFASQANPRPVFGGQLKLSTQVAVKVFMISSTDHATGKTGLEGLLTVYLTKSGGIPALVSNSQSELDATNTPGLYSLTLTTSHTGTVGELQMRVTASGADPTEIKYQVVTYLTADLATPTNITAGTMTTVTNLTNAASAGDLTSTMKSSVNAEVLDVLATDTYAEPGQGTPSATLSLSAKINYLFKAWRNRLTQTSTAYKLYADDGTTVDQKATVSDDGSTYDKGEIASGP